jgi:carbon storage regulator CsrA
LLVLQRKVGEGVTITVDGRRVRVSVVQVRDFDRVRLGFEADDDVIIDRDEVDARKRDGRTR